MRRLERLHVRNSDAKLLGDSVTYAEIKYIIYILVPVTFDKVCIYCINLKEFNIILSYV